MSVYAGLDTSLDAVAICVIAETGEMLWQGKVLGDPDAVTAALQRWRDDLVRVGLEAGATSEWIGGHLVDEGFPVVCLESRHVKAALGAMTVKTDRNDAQGIAQIVRTGWFKAVHLKSAAGQRLRTLTAAQGCRQDGHCQRAGHPRLVASLGAKDWRRHARSFRGKGSTA
ncbi:MAG: IS110 family transposase, partial [Mesorhizobium sp.]|uniref:IS110 family transposase n=1 Tax=Mesorhizobium sp. TaxID=1871066 RepID=UPI001229EE90